MRRVVGVPLRNGIQVSLHEHIFTFGNIAEGTKVFSHTLNCNAGRICEAQSFKRFC